eukprot:Ihof_evm7s171 gene=Ihof_evmTU7s171
MGGRQSTPQETTFERPDRGEEGFRMQFSPELVNALINNGPAPGAIPSKRGQGNLGQAGKSPKSDKEEAKNEKSEEKEEAHGGWERRRSRADYIKRLVDQAREEGFAQGKAATEAAQEEFVKKYHQNLMEKEAEALKQQGTNMTSQFTDLANDLEMEYGPLKAKEGKCKDEYEATLQCYINNPEKPLDCMEEVKRFKECAKKHTE